MLFLPLCLCLAPALPAPADQKEVRKQFVELSAKQDKDALVALWKANPGLVLQVIDADLEGSLREQEKGEPAGSAKVKEKQQRALFGAECAALATGHPILPDYAASFVGWNADQKRQFRDGQKVYRAAAEALQKGDKAAALAKGKECVERASALGDWWGTAMGYDAQGRAAQALGGIDDALTALTQARLLNHDLGLRDDELEELVLLTDLCSAAERWQRALACARDGQALARALGKTDVATALAAKEASVRAKLPG
jgi:tetratricopeptide (TPR) repeat protein